MQRNLFCAARLSKSSSLIEVELRLISTLAIHHSQSLPALSEYHSQPFVHRSFVSCTIDACSILLYFLSLFEKCFVTTTSPFHAQPEPVLSKASVRPALLHRSTFQYTQLLKMLTAIHVHVSVANSKASILLILTPVFSLQCGPLCKSHGPVARVPLNPENHRL